MFEVKPYLKKCVDKLIFKVPILAFTLFSYFFLEADTVDGTNMQNDVGMKNTSLSCVNLSVEKKEKVYSSLESGLISSPSVTSKKKLAKNSKNLKQLNPLKLFRSSFSKDSDDVSAVLLVNLRPI